VVIVRFRGCSEYLHIVGFALAYGFPRQRAT
jgi:hypothetical protein